MLLPIRIKRDLPQIIMSSPRQEETVMAERPLWKPSPERIEEANLTRFARQAIRDWKLGFNDYPAFYRWTIEHPEQFWDSLWKFAGVRASAKGTRVLVNGERMPGARWYPETRLNFAENLLRRRDASTALAFWGEDKGKRRPPHRGGPAGPEARRRRSLRQRSTGRFRHCVRAALGGFRRGSARDRRPLRAAALRPSAVHPVLIRHDRGAQVHRARGGRRAAQAPVRAAAALRLEARRSPVLLHHARLDDVELARIGARFGRDSAAL